MSRGAVTGGDRRAVGNDRECNSAGLYRFRQRYQSLLREEIAHTVATPADIEDELRHLIAVVRA